MPLYRLTFKTKDSQISQVEFKASNFPEVVRLQVDIFDLVRIERINRINGQVMKGTGQE
jgi:hypothetical protein